MSELVTRLVAKDDMSAPLAKAEQQVKQFGNKTKAPLAAAGQAFTDTNKPMLQMTSQLTMLSSAASAAGMGGPLGSMLSMLGPLASAHQQAGADAAKQGQAVGGLGSMIGKASVAIGAWTPQLLAAGVVIGGVIAIVNRLTTAWKEDEEAAKQSMANTERRAREHAQALAQIESSVLRSRGEGVTAQRKEMTDRQRDEMRGRQTQLQDKLGELKNPGGTGEEFEKYLTKRKALEQQFYREMDGLRTKHDEETAGFERDIQGRITEEIRRSQAERLRDTLSGFALARQAADDALKEEMIQIAARVAAGELGGKREQETQTLREEATKRHAERMKKIAKDETDAAFDLAQAAAAKTMAAAAAATAKANADRAEKQAKALADLSAQLAGEDAVRQVLRNTRRMLMEEEGRDLDARLQQLEDHYGDRIKAAEKAGNKELAAALKKEKDVATRQAMPAGLREEIDQITSAFDDKIKLVTYRQGFGTASQIADMEKEKEGIEKQKQQAIAKAKADAGGAGAGPGQAFQAAFVGLEAMGARIQQSAASRAEDKKEKATVDNTEALKQNAEAVKKSTAAAAGLTKKLDKTKAGFGP
ncbi:MAG TPA: hypothetical protein VM098_04665 [Phycisphaerae bacterium]|nr:hypothetical protein [Phycisphaerae bacterium]